MKFLSSVLLEIACLVIKSSAFSLERGLPDGIYEIVQDHNRTASLRSIQRRTDDLYQKSKWPAWEQYHVPIPKHTMPVCLPSDHKLNQTNYDRATANLFSYCLNFNLAPRGGYVSVSGDEVAFVCSWGKRNRCHKYEYREAMEKIDHRCGQGSYGNALINKWRKSYGRAHVGSKVCENLNWGATFDYKVQMLPVMAVETPKKGNETEANKAS